MAPQAKVEAKLCFVEILPSAQEAKLLDGELKSGLKQNQRNKIHLQNTEARADMRLNSHLGLSRTGRKGTQKTGAKWAGK